VQSNDLTCCRECLGFIMHEHLSIVVHICVPSVTKLQIDDVTDVCVCVSYSLAAFLPPGSTPCSYTTLPPMSHHQVIQEQRHTLMQCSGHNIQYTLSSCCCFTTCLLHIIAIGLHSYNNRSLPVGDLVSPGYINIPP